MVTRSPTISELIASNSAAVILGAPPHRAGLAFCWPYFRLYLLNMVWALPILPFVDDWTWGQVLKISGACAAVGFVTGFTASLIYHVTPATGRLRTLGAVALAAPAGVVPILCAVSDGADMLALAFQYHLFTVWLAAIVVYCIVGWVFGGLSFLRAKERRLD